MDTPQNIQIINDAQGHPAFVVIPYADYLAQRDQDKDLVPNEVARRILVDDMTPVRAWREYLSLTQKEVAARLGISQPAYAEQENSTGKLRKATREKIATALGITPGQLDVVA
ncbi:helix-turn-helix domain-containing protein [Cupriavidus alkaliphilus]|uniref:helix-turn-helix domain-containing protein n=1 Tax=Cupriavidus alkaliphilus TaxID=942866 RepID=UPI00160D9406|nr:helix-turn-helix transcriptional regulator [Cupriavidus alkaliphilus]MBB2918118.1 DNA-binding XRE family transcriptional regulator [Cupriavidus alkaliphilus]